MIIIDLNQVLLSSMMAHFKAMRKKTINTDFFRHIALNMIVNLNKKFRGEYGRIIIANDDVNLWRKQIFPYYKANRKEMQAASPYDWNEIFRNLNLVREEIKQNLPYLSIQVPTAEADDIIATLCLEHNTFEKILIVSGDKDFIQLHGFSISQYDPVRKKMVTGHDPQDYLLEHIIKGDSGDGIPNILSPDNTFIVKSRQGRLTAKKIETLKKQVFDNESEKINFARNKALIDFREIPVYITQQVIDQFTQNDVPSRAGLFNYFLTHNLRNLLEEIQNY